MKPWRVKDHKGSEHYVFRCDGGWSVREKSTGNAIGSYGDKARAERVRDHLNGGGAFDGWTPSFILLRFSAPEAVAGDPDYGG